MDDANINTFPDSVLLEILSFLPIRTVVCTSVLSRRWRYLWASVPVLNCNEIDFPSNVRTEFVTIMDQILLRRIGGVKAFHLFFHYSNTYNCIHVDRWITHLAAVRNVEKLSVILTGTVSAPRSPFGYSEWSYPDNFKLQLSPYDCSSVVALEIKGCYFESAPNGKTVFSSLKTLTLRDTAFNQQQIARMLQGCPMLESLNIKNCSQLDNVQISIPSLVRFTMVSCKDLKFLEIVAPVLQFCELRCSGYKLLEDRLHKIFHVLAHLKILKACGCLLQALSRCELDTDHHDFSNLEEVILVECKTKNFAEKIPYMLLERSPSLRRIIINNEKCCAFLSSNEDWALSSRLSFSLPCLRFVEITLFNGTRSEVNLVEYFLKNAPLLESVKLVFGPRNKGAWTFVANEVLRLQRDHPAQRITTVLIFTCSD